MTLLEVQLLVKSWRLKNDLEWDRARTIAAYTYNAGIIAAGVKNPQKYFIKPLDVYRIESDKVGNSQVNIKESFAKAKLLEERAVKAGLIKPKGERKSLKEIFKAD